MTDPVEIIVRDARETSSGWKLGRWVDTVTMQRALGPGGDLPPQLGEPTT